MRRMLHKWFDIYAQIYAASCALLNDSASRGLKETIPSCRDQIVLSDIQYRKMLSTKNVTRQQLDAELGQRAFYRFAPRDLQDNAVEHAYASFKSAQSNLTRGHSKGYELHPLDFSEWKTLNFESIDARIGLDGVARLTPRFCKRMFDCDSTLIVKDRQFGMEQTKKWAEDVKFGMSAVVAS